MARRRSARRRTRRAGLGRWSLALGAPLLAVALLWGVPPQLDWARYRGAIAALGSARFSCPVVIEGSVHLTLLPRPSLSATRVHLCDDGRTAAGGSLTVRALRLSVAPWSLLHGRLAVRDLALDHPVLRLPRPASGMLALLSDMGGSGQFAARVTDGEVDLAGLDLTGIDATLAGSDGAVGAAGTARMAGQAWRLTLHRAAETDRRVERPAADLHGGMERPAAALDVTLEQAAGTHPLALRFTGAAGLGSIVGHLSVRGAATEADARLSLSRDVAGQLRVAADQVRLARAGMRLAGGALLRLGGAAPMLHVSVDSATLGRTDLAMLAGLARAVAAPALARRLSIDLAVAGLTVDGETVGKLHAALRPVADGWALGPAEATLPGAAHLAFVPDADAGQGGALRLDAPDLPRTLGFLSGLFAPALQDAVGLAPAAAHLSGHLAFAPGRLEIGGLAGTAGMARVTGQAMFGSAMVVDLGLDRANLGPVLAAGVPLALVRALPGGMSLRLAVAHAGLGPVALDDLVIDVAVARNGLALRNLSGNLGTARIAASAYLAPDGAVRGLRVALDAPHAAVLRPLAPAWFAPAPGFWDLPLRLQLTGQGPPKALALAGDLAMAGATLHAEPVVDLTRGLTRWRAVGNLSLRHPGVTQLIEALGLTHALGLEAAPDWLGAGSFALVGRMEAGPGHIALSSFGVSAGLLHATGALSLTLRDTPHLSGQIAAETLPLPIVLEDAPLPFALLRGWQADVALRAQQVMLGFRPLVRNLAGSVHLHDGKLSLGNMTATLGGVAQGSDDPKDHWKSNQGGGRLSGSVTLDGTATPPAATLTLALQDAQIDGPLAPHGAALDLLSGTASGTAALTTQGYSTTAMVARLAGTLHLHVANGAVAGFDLFTLRRLLQAPGAPDPAALHAALSRGATGFTALDATATLERGVLHLQQVIGQGPAGTAHLSGTLALLPPLADLALDVAPAGIDAAPMAERLTGSPAKPLRTDEFGAELAGR